jgi:hypothetical protein
MLRELRLLSCWMLCCCLVLPCVPRRNGCIVDTDGCGAGGDGFATDGPFCGAGGDGFATDGPLCAEGIHCALGRWHQGDPEGWGGRGGTVHYCWAHRRWRMTSAPLFSLWLC